MYLAEDVPAGALLVVVPKDSPKARASLRKVAARFGERGKEAVIRQWSNLPPGGDARH